VFLHGLSGSAATQAPVGAWLAAEGWSVRAIDLPGHGRSTWLADTGAPISDPEALDASAYGLDRVAGVVARAIAALELSERPALVGHSWGAGIAAAAVLEAAPVTRLILVDPPFVTAEGALMIASGLVDELRPDIESATAVARGEEPEADPVELAARAEALSQASAAAIMAAATQTGYGPFEFLARWRAARPRIRVDMICGNPALGSLVPGRVRLLLRLLLGPSHVHYFRDSGHSPQRTHFAEFMAVLGRLLRAA
jgi:pimeloyl-ACP methyl ester carboxylesterase